MQVFHRNIPRLRILLFSFESLLIFFSVYGVCFLTLLARKGKDALWLFDPNPTAAKVIVIVLVCQVCMYFTELYDYKLSQGRREFTIRLFQSLGFACLALGILYLLLPVLSIGQINFVLALPLAMGTLFAWREIYPKIIRSEAFVERVLILGSSTTAHKILEEVAEAKDTGYEIVAVATEPFQEGNLFGNPIQVPAVLPIDEFPDKAREIPVDRIVVAMGDRRGRLPFETLLDCRFQGIQVDEAASFYEKLTGKILLDHVRPSWFIFSEGFRKGKFTLTLKRLTDIAFSGAILLLASPFMLLFALAIKLDSRGPVIYKQDRVGEGWKDYTIYKFRSMVENAESCGAAWAQKDDPRVTRVGRFLRKYRVDELPQLFNVLKGDMSLVGPRPERRCFVKELVKEVPYYPQRLFVKPGVTGWAQIKYHYGASKDETKEKLQYDLYYIKHMSFLFDLSIIFDTVRVVLSGAGSR